MSKFYSSNASADAESYSGTLIHSLRTRSRAAGNQPNDRGHTGPRSDGELNTAISPATARLSGRLVGSRSTETAHRTLMERLLRIAEQVDERTPPQFEAFQREGKGARQQILRTREDVEAARGFSPEQLKIIRNQCETFDRQLKIAEQHFKEIKQELRTAENRIQETASEHNALEQRLRSTEPKIVAAEEDLRRIDEWRRNAEQRFSDTDEQLQGAVQWLNDLKHQPTEVISQIKIFESQIKSCEDRVQRNNDLLVATKKIFDEQTQRRENVEISIGALAHQIQQLKAELANVSDARVKSIDARLTSNRRMQAFAMLVWIMSLLLVCYIVIGNRGWSVLTQLLSQWVPALFI